MTQHLCNRGACGRVPIAPHHGVMEMADNNPQDFLDRPLWGWRAIGQHIGKPRRQTYHLLERGFIDASKVGYQWTSTPRRLNRSLGIREGE